MSRPPRDDPPGAWHHVFNRGIAKRPIFENRADVRYFHAQLAHAARAGRLEVHAHCALTTHFHLLVRSPEGQLADAMRRIQNAYSRWFNRRRRRDGPLFRGRYGARRITTELYREAVVWYIDRNPLDAALAASPEAYPFGSASNYARRDGPRWLTRSYVEALVAGIAGAFDPAQYGRISKAQASEALVHLVESRMARGEIPEDPMDDLLRAASIDVQRWLEHKARLADATASGLVLLRPQTVRQAAANFAGGLPAAAEIECGLLRSVCGLAFDDIAARTGAPTTSVRRMIDLHLQALRRDPVHASLAAQIVHCALLVDFPRPRRMLDTPAALPPGVPEAASAGADGAPVGPARGW